VLLVEADVRRPSLHDLLQISTTWGLSDGLRATDENKFPLTQVSPCLSVLLGGRPDANPVGGLSSERMRHVIQDAAAHFDWVIIDTPPAALLPDADLICRHADGALLVIQAGATPYPAIQKAIAALGQDRILGVVLNRAATVPLDSNGYYGDEGYWSAETTTRSAS
jgi:Mrp family chromosome partitioning ATPase